MRKQMCSSIQGTAPSTKGRDKWAQFHSQQVHTRLREVMQNQMLRKQISVFKVFSHLPLKIIWKNTLTCSFYVIKFWFDLINYAEADICRNVATSLVQNCIVYDGNEQQVSGIQHYFH